MVREKPARQLLAAHRGHVGVVLLDALQQAERRAIIKEHMAATGVTFHGMAKTLGIARRTLVAFMDGAELYDRAYRQVAEWCAGSDAPKVRAELVAIALLCTWFPARHVKGAREEMWQFVKQMYAARNTLIPGFVSDDVDAWLPPPT